MATGRTVNSKIVAGGTNTQRIVAAGNEVYRVIVEGVIRYDRKDYVLTAQTATIQVPITGGSLTLTGVYSKYSGYNNSNQRVTNADAAYTYSPTSFPSNAYNETARTGNVIVSQEDSGLEVPIPYSQPADGHDEGTPVCTSMTITIVDVPDIPASGGSVNSCDISVQANGYLDYEWASGGHSVGPATSWTLSSSDYTVAWTGVTAQSKGTVPSQRTELQNKLICLVTLNADHSITARREITVYQQANQVEGYTPYEYELYVNTNVTGQYPAAGGVITVEYSAQEKRKPIYTSKATGSTYEYSDIGCDLTSTYGTIANPSVTGIGTTTLTLGPNTTGNRTVTITLAYEYDATKKATTSFVQTYSTYSYAYSYLSNYTGNGQLNTWDQVHGVSQDISNWARPIQDVYAVTEAGNTVYRTGTTSSANAVQPDTYFYNNDNYTFHTRNVTTAGAAGTTHLWYKNPTFSFTVPSTIPASATTFTMSGSTSYVKYYVTVYEAGSPIMNKTLYTGGNLTVQCGANTSTATTRVFTVSFEDYYNTENAEMNSKQVTQEAKVANSISVDINEWTICTRTIPGARANFVVTSVGGGWNASYDSRYFTVSPASGSEGDTRVTVTAIAQGPDGTTVDFVHSILSVGRARVDIIYDTSC